MNNAITAAEVAVYMLEAFTRESADARADVRAIRASLDRLKALAAELLEAARATPGA
jgi:hypothetical protein